MSVLRYPRPGKNRHTQYFVNKVSCDSSRTTTWGPLLGTHIIIFKIAAELGRVCARANKNTTKLSNFLSGLLLNSVSLVAISLWMFSRILTVRSGFVLFRFPGGTGTWSCIFLGVVQGLCAFLPLGFWYMYWNSVWCLLLEGGLGSGGLNGIRGRHRKVGGTGVGPGRMAAWVLRDSWQGRLQVCPLKKTEKLLRVLKFD